MIYHLSSHAAINTDVLTRDETSLVRAKKEYHIGYIQWIANTSSRLLNGIGTFIYSVGSINPPRRYTVYSHLSSKTDCQGVSQSCNASIIAVEPGQIGGLEDNGERISLCGWVLLWSPELLHGTELERQIDRYQFFSYFFDGSLRMEPDEWLCITQLVTQMRQELQTHEDSPSLRNVLLGYLHLILEYCNRIYQRQLFEEDRGEADLLKRFHNLLQTYFRENRQLMQGLPTVAWCAFELAYSPRYFGDIVHKATGGTAIGYIHNYVINQAKILLMQGHNISETSRLLGFDFPHHFTRLFKRITGLTPSEFLGKNQL